MGKGIARVSGGVTGVAYTPPANALNVTGATVAVNYLYNGNAASQLQFYGVITLPSSAPAEIEVVAVDPTGNQYPVQTITGASGATVNYAGITSALQPAASQSWSLVFTVSNSAGAPTASPYTVTGVTVAAPAVSALAGTELTASRYTDPNGALHVVIQATVSTVGTQPINVTLWKTGGAQGTQWLGWWKVTTAGQLIQVGTSTSNMTMLYAPVLADETWQIAASPGCIDGAAAIPSGAVYSSGFAVNRPANPAATVCSGAYVDAITYGASGGGGTTFGWGNMYLTIARNPNIFAVRFTVQTGAGTGGGFVAGGVHPNEDPTNYPDGHFYDVPTNEVVGTGSVTIDVSNGNNWLVPVDGNTTCRIRVYVQTQAQASTTPPTWTQQTCWSSGVGVSTAGTNAYQDLVVDATRVSLAGSRVSGLGGNLGITPAAKLDALNAIGTNLVSNPGFEQGLLGWTVSSSGGAAATTTATHNHTANGSLSLTLAAILSAGAVGAVQSFAANPGDVIQLSCWAEGDTGNNIQLVLVVTFYNAAGGYLSQSNVAGVNVIPTAWTQYAGVSAAAPAGTAMASVQIYLSFLGAGTGNAYLDDVFAQRLPATASGVTTDANGNIIANLAPLGGLQLNGSNQQFAATGYTMTINSSGQIVVANLPAVAGLPSLPSAVYPQGSVVIDTTNSKIYRNVSGSAWVVSSDPADLVAGAIATGVSLAAAQVAAGTFIAGVVYAGAVACSQLTSGTITATINMTSPSLTISGSAFTININSTAGISVTGNGYTTTINNGIAGVAVTNGTVLAELTPFGIFVVNDSNQSVQYANLNGTGGIGTLNLYDSSGHSIQLYPGATATYALSGSYAVPANAMEFALVIYNGNVRKIALFGN